MKMLKKLLGSCSATFLAYLAGAALTAQAQVPALTNLTAHAITETITAQYTLFLPKDYDASSTNRWPVILFLHGIGERGSDVWKTSAHGPIKYAAKHPEFPFILITPQCQDGHKWSDEILNGILDEVIAKHAVDTNRIYLTGLSMGGFGTWSLATFYPQRFAAVAPICGGDSMIGVIGAKLYKEHGAQLKALPFWAFHSQGDPVVPVGESERMIKALQDLGCREVKLTIYPSVFHDCWTETYNNPELYAWFLKHSR